MPGQKFDIDPSICELIDDKEKCHENVFKLLGYYIQTNPDAIDTLIQAITILTRQALAFKHAQVLLGQKAIENFIGTVDTSSYQLKSKDFVIWYWAAMKLYFPDGIRGHTNKSEKIFFDKFVECLKQNKDDLVDSEWAKEIVTCNNYLKLLLENNP